MDVTTYLQINMIPIAVLIIMRANSHQTLSYTWRSRALRFIMINVAFIMFLDIITWSLDGKQDGVAETMLWIANSIYYVAMEFASYIWFLYVKDSVKDGLGQRGKDVLWPSIPLLGFYALLAGNYWTHAIFYIDENNQYVRGNLFLLHTALSLGYMIGASIMALVYSRRAEDRELKREYRLLAAFVVLPVVAGMVQVFFYGTDLLWPFTTASLVMIYINQQWEQVTRDSLTGLNNRRRLDQYLESLPMDEVGGNWYLMVLDVNHFKKVNDTYGHVTGDLVLKLVAEQLKRLFGYSKAFLSRYGGDEFVIVIQADRDELMEEYMTAIKAAMFSIEWGDEHAWNIEVSIGCARYDKETMSGSGEWFMTADQRMYQQKKQER